MRVDTSEGKRFPFALRSRFRASCTRTDTKKKGGERGKYILKSRSKSHQKRVGVVEGIVFLIENMEEDNQHFRATLEVGDRRDSRRSGEGGTRMSGSK